MSTLFHDIECYRNFFFLGFKRESDGIRLGFEMSTRKNTLDIQRVRKILRNNLLIGYNCAGYDLPMIALALKLVDEGLSPREACARLKLANDQIITGKARAWEVPRLIGAYVPDEWDSIDLKDVQPNGQQTKPGESGGSVFTSLKTLNGRVHGKRMQDLPITPDAVLTDEEMEQTADYCLQSDLDATHNLFDAVKEPLDLRAALGKEYGADFRSRSDSQIGEAIVRKRVEYLTKAKIQKVETPPGTTFRYPVPAFMRFETPALQDILERIREADFMVGPDGKTISPPWLKAIEVSVGSTIYSMGIGGLHSTEKSRVVESDDDYVLVDADVTSQYPSIIMALGLFPKAIGKHFLPVYKKIKDDRVAAKNRVKVIDSEIAFIDIKRPIPGALSAEDVKVRVAELKRERQQQVARDKGSKISLNGVYGKLGSRYSILYAPHLLISVTLTGQLTLLMLIEKAEAAGVQVISGNTDGVLFRCPREMFDGVGSEGAMKDRLLPSALSNITDDWEATTGFGLEFAEYKSVFNRDVNNYYAIKANGGHKRIGVFCNPWSMDKSDRDERKLLMKNPTALICSDAALALIKHGTPIEETIYGCSDIRQFVTVIKADGGATWRGRYLGKTVRYYWCTDGDEILKATPNATGTYAKVPKTDGAAPCMTLPDEFPDDICYDRYLAETREILMSIGFVRRPPPPEKTIRLTKANRQVVLMAWTSAA